MKTILLIKKNGDVVEKNVNEIKFDELYKYCGYKNNNNFSRIHSYVYVQKNATYTIYGKDTGRANHENKYELPPPIDEKLFFGTLCIVKTDNDDSVVSLDSETWTKVYEDLFGGFEDIENEEDESRSDDSEVYSDDEYTKEGYLKDDFIVEDDELEEEEYESYENED